MFGLWNNDYQILQLFGFFSGSVVVVYSDMDINDDQLFFGFFMWTWHRSTTLFK